MTQIKFSLIRFLKGFKTLLKQLFLNDKKLAFYFEQLDTFQKLDVKNRLPLFKDDLYPILYDNTKTTHFDSHYIYHPAWAARIIKQTLPVKHIDVSSSLHFCSILSAFVPTDFYDYRPVNLNLDNLRCQHADLTNLNFATGSINSLSCMHTLEHVGLGRYGDPLDPEGDIKAINELMRVCSIQGNLLLVVPVGRKKIMFNAHRIYNAKEFAEYLPGFDLEDFSLITDNNTFINNASFDDALSQNYACGCYWFKKVSD